MNDGGALAVVERGGGGLRRLACPALAVVDELLLGLGLCYPLFCKSAVVRGVGDSPRVGGGRGEADSEGQRVTSIDILDGGREVEGWWIFAYILADAPW